ncbi:ultra-long-chain fatty acid omega-hydroxylase-like [Amphiura filiformis]|uniref:ultra-long-chain fatty acid omega-hydroxylase-like n=1 Tax=Amphiura filiformis TaxID=82378 RepID=UPI003B20D8E6
MDLSTCFILVGCFLLVPLVYLIVSIAKFMRTVRHHTKAVLQWPGPERHWFWGTMHHMPLLDPKVRASGIADTQVDYLVELTKRYPFGHYDFFTFMRPQLMCNHPNLIRQILKRSDPKPIGIGNASYNFLLPWLGDGLLLASGKKWFRNRRLLTPAFHFDILKPYIYIYNKEVDILLNKMDVFLLEDQSLEVCKHISLCTLDILLRCAFSQDSNCQMKWKDDPYVEAVRQLSLSIIERVFVPIHTLNFVYKTSKEGVKFFEVCEYVHGVADKVISNRRKEMATPRNDSKRKYLDFLDILVAARDDEGRGLTDLEIRNEVDTFLFEGHDTTASGLTYMLYCFAKYPEYQQKAQQEIDDIMEARGSDYIQWEDLSKMTYLTLCIKESLRMYPPVAIISRIIEDDVEIDGKVLPAGVQANVSTYGLHHNPEVWVDHMEFKPERFLPENIQKKDPFAFLPFAAGPRNCIGQTFAMNEMKVVIARILRRFDLTLDPSHEVHFAQELLLKPYNDIKLKLNCRR